MRKVTAGVLALFVVCALTGEVSAASKQRIAITITPGTVNTFVLTTPTEGVIARDNGLVSWFTEKETVGTRDGQQVRTWVGVGIFGAKRGELRIRFRIDWRNAGRGHEAGTGTWTVIDGTRAYKGVTGSGRSAHVWLPRGPVAARADGFVQVG